MSKLIDGLKVNELEDMPTPPATGGSQSEDASRNGTLSADELVPGGDWVFGGEDAELRAIWGDGMEILWAAGEPLVLCGPDGANKTTLALRLTRARLGLDAGRVLGRDVKPECGKILYLAADRPNQARYNLRRMCTEDERALLNERLMVRDGLLLPSVMDDPERVLKMARRAGAGTVVLDAAKDITGGEALGEERVGMKVNAAMQALIGAGIEVILLHHHRKATSENRRPNSISDVYGSRWLTAGAGSVVMLWAAEPGDVVVDLIHLKPPADKVGPLTLTADTDSGTLAVQQEADPVAVVRAAHAPLSTRAVAAALYDRNPSAAATERVRRKLDRDANSDDPAVARLHANDGRGTILWHPFGNPTPGPHGDPTDPTDDAAA